MIAGLPIFGIFGHHESGKTTLIEKLLPRLLARRLSVTVAKVHGSRLEVDRPGKDSDRLYQAGADVFMAGKAEGFARFHLVEGESLGPRLADLARRYDLVLVEGRKQIECERLWLLGEGEAAPPPEATGILAVLGRDCDRAEAAWAILEPWLSRRWLKAPVYGGVMIGGRSSRMGTPKHLLPCGTAALGGAGPESQGQCGTAAPGGEGGSPPRAAELHTETWIERTVRLLGGATERVVILGRRGAAVPGGLRASAGRARRPGPHGGAPGGPASGAGGLVARLGLRPARPASRSASVAPLDASSGRLGHAPAPPGPRRR